MPDPDVVTAAVGRNVRAERTRKAWTLDELAARSGISKGMLVQVEQARTNPSLQTICKLADALGASVAWLVEAPEAPVAQVMRGHEGIVLWRGKRGSSATLLVASGVREQVELWRVRMAPGDALVSDAHAAGTRELLTVIAGELTLEVAGTPHLLGADDAIAFAGDRPHAYRNAGVAPLSYTLAVIHPGRDGDGPPHPRPGA